MRTTTEKKTSRLSKFLKQKISNSESITGGVSGPIDRDKVKKPENR